jgi:hypothetical protein
MDRRSFISGTSGYVLASTLLGDLLTPTRARAQGEAAVAITVVTILATIASKIVELMKASGPSIVDLMTLQVQMMQAISDELRAVNEGIIKILESIQDLKKVLKNVPEEVVLQFYRTNVAAQNLHYLEVISTYSKKRAASGLEEARRITQDELQNGVINKMLEARLNLQTTYYAASIPSMCTSAFVETHAMIMAGTDRIRIGEAVAAYLRWFNLVIDSEENVNSLKKQIGDQTAHYRAKRRELERGHGYSCYNGFEEQTSSNYAVCAGSTINISCTLGRAYPKYVPLVHGPLAEMTSDLQARDILSPAAVPVESEITFSNKINASGYHCKSQGVPGPRPQGCPEEAWQVSCPDLEKKLTATDKASLDEVLELEESQVLALYELYDAGIAGRAFLMSMSKALAKKGGQ